VNLFRLLEEYIGDAISAARKMFTAMATVMKKLSVDNMHNELESATLASAWRTCPSVFPAPVARLAMSRCETISNINRWFIHVTRRCGDCSRRGAVTRIVYSSTDRPAQHVYA